MDFTSLLVALAPMLCDSMAAKIDYIAELNQASDSLRTALAELKAIHDDLKMQVEQAQLEGQSCTNHVKEWMRAAGAAETEAASIIAKLERRLRRRSFVGSCRITCHSRYKLSKKVSQNLEKVNHIKEKYLSLRVIGFSHQEAVVELPSRPAVGLRPMLEQICQFLVEEETGMIGIYGIGGVGKTTLLQNLNNEFLTRSHSFDVVICLTVSKDFSTSKIQFGVGARLGLKWEGAESQEQRALKIFRVLRQKTLLLLLDDVWEGIDLEKIGIPLPRKENNSKVLFTTRSMDVCSAMDAQRKLKVDFLGKDESWELFRAKVGNRELLESPSVQPIAEKLVMKCGGLPLALMTVGRAMANKETEQEWIHAVQALEKSPTDLRGMGYIFALLKFSYDSLESDLLRACFCYCALFPEDSPIEKEQLIEYWIGEGFITGFNGFDAYNKGHALIGDLKGVCLLESADDKITQVKMHSVVRSFALWILSEQGKNRDLILVTESSGLIEAPIPWNWRRKLVISLLNSRIQTLPDKPFCYRLTTLLLQKNERLKTLPNELFVHMPALRVLDLSFTGIIEIPACIECLLELRHLDLSGTKLKELPKELGKLEKLMHLDLQQTMFLQTIPREAILGLKKLKVLNLYYSYAGWDLSEFTNEDELTFADLECLKHLITLGITILSLDTLKILNQYASLHSRIQFLYLEVGDELLYLDFLSSSLSLRRLSVKNCDDLKFLKISEEGLPSLQVLNLHSLPNLTTVWKNISAKPECLRNLRYLNISCCNEIKNITWTMQLWHLQEINLCSCGALSEVVEGDEALGVSELKLFPSLRTLSLTNLSELKSVFPVRYLFPKLEIVSVNGCPLLKKLPFIAREGSKLFPTVSGTQEWWDGLEWAGIEPEKSCIPCFEPA